MAQLFGRAAATGGAPTGLGVRIESDGLTIHVGSAPGATPADLAAALPVQAIDADLGELVQGPPEVRRRLLEWGVFHVEHRYLPLWRRFRRALLQRNAVLRDGGADKLLDTWDDELAQAGEAIQGYRERYLERLRPLFYAKGEELTGLPVGLAFQRGWSPEKSLVEALREHRASDRALGYTRMGPQRADLVFQIDEERSRWRASKGQQKLLAAATILAQTQLVAETTGHAVALVVDEPAADLDASRLAAFMAAIAASPAQVFLASITTQGVPLAEGARMFHVEHGRCNALL